MLYIIRGLPGSGKTTLAHRLASATGGVVYEADDLFTEAGEYRFDPNRLGEAHEQCFRNTAAALHEGRTVCVANTFTRRYEWERYQLLAQKLGVPCQILICQGNFGSVHDVPAETYHRMKLRWEWQ